MQQTGSIFIYLVSMGDPILLHKSICQYSPVSFSNLVMMAHKSSHDKISHKFLTNLIFLSSVLVSQKITENSILSFF